MTLYPPRERCNSCNEALPRAALHRCPFCHEPIARSAGGSELKCSLCNMSIPRAHAGGCPSCAVAGRYRSGKAMTGGRRP